MSDRELLREAVLLLALMERNGHDAERGLIVISDAMWRDLTRNFRDLMNEAMRGKLPEPVR